jgi:argininosuccinate lyase
VPFRQAHEVVGRIVRAAEAAERSLGAFSLEELREFSPVFEASAVGLTAEQVVEARQVYGGPAPAQVELQVRAAQERLAAQRAWVEEYAAKLPTLESVTANDDVTAAGDATANDVSS